MTYVKINSDLYQTWEESWDTHHYSACRVMGEPSPLPTKIRDIAGPGDLQRRVRVTVIMARIVEEQANKGEEHE